MIIVALHVGMDDRRRRSGERPRGFSMICRRQHSATDPAAIAEWSTIAQGSSQAGDLPVDDLPR